MMGCAEFSSYRIGGGFLFDAISMNLMTLSSRRIGTSAEFMVSLVCTIPQDRYLDVLSDDVIWLTEANRHNVDVEVKSNVRWSIE